ncbi:Cytochrome c oxidase assembly protein COX19 [Penicillium atrosanguineum]|uniref:Uncharacterized protein n=1 Tax=Penicillium atrosanguineum TaxID=1132637 RepID=A0A9W9PQX1_9EURO|nr:Cytochrome c oxidase assembly protein COX19 [Penicillium atrosanguineum]KAJ5137896.1 hypothetical protein N7526_004129 [Penicillium atrosanguineum]KAJ5289560.1 Cytochrome c oxidase assembly protein COX19 [Penicillium atrosanguineum]KAJ5307381.1 hypothetical protein N7476_008037 [Penicillium atrosanguineum]
MRSNPRKVCYVGYGGKDAEDRRMIVMQHKIAGGEHGDLVDEKEKGRFQYAHEGGSEGAWRMADGVWPSNLW